MATKKSTPEASPPRWMSSPPTPANPEHVESIPGDRVEVVEHGGNLHDRITLHRWHRYAPPEVFKSAGPILSRFFEDAWSPSFASGEGPNSDARPENREIRARLVTLATEAAEGRPSPARERRRMWRFIDWEIRTEAAAFLELAGWPEYAAAFRALPPITGPTLPPGASKLFRAAHRATDKASTDALHGVRPYKRDRSKLVPYTQERTRRLAPQGGAGVGHSLWWAVREAMPAYRRHVVKDEVPDSGRTDLGLAVLAGSYARTCIEHDPRIPDARVAHVLAELAGSAEALLREIIAMGRA